MSEKNTLRKQIITYRWKNRKDLRYIKKNVKKIYNCSFYNYPLISKLLNYECYITFFNFVFYRQQEDDVELLTELLINEYYIQIKNMGYIKYYTTFLKEYFNNLKTQIHGDAINNISLVQEQFTKAFEKLPDNDMEQQAVISSIFSLNTGDNNDESKK